MKFIPRYVEGAAWEVATFRADHHKCQVCRQTMKVPEKHVVVSDTKLILKRSLACSKCGKSNLVYETTNPLSGDNLTKYLDQYPMRTDFDKILDGHLVCVYPRRGTAGSIVFDMNGVFPIALFYSNGMFWTFEASDKQYTFGQVTREFETYRYQSDMVAMSCSALAEHE